MLRWLDTFGNAYTSGSSLGYARGSAMALPPRALAASSTREESLVRQRRHHDARRKRHGVGRARADPVQVKSPAVGRPADERRRHAALLFAGGSTPLAEQLRLAAVHRIERDARPNPGGQPLPVRRDGVQVVGGRRHEPSSASHQFAPRGRRRAAVRHRRRNTRRRTVRRARESPGARRAASARRCRRAWLPRPTTGRARPRARTRAVAPSRETS